MTDKELLEFAAKAVNGGVWHPVTHGQPWNPLIDDGDALRLAVKLCLNVSITPSGNNIRLGKKDIFEITSGSERKHGDASLATRRAIVRAAAEIGKVKSSISPSTLKHEK